METISWEDFAKVELRVGQIVKAEIFAEARKPAYILHVDFGPEVGVKKSSAQITALYQPEALVGKQVVGVINFPKKQIGPVMSECLVTPAFAMNARRSSSACRTGLRRWGQSCCNGSNCLLKNKKTAQTGTVCAVGTSCLCPMECVITGR